MDDKKKFTSYSFNWKQPQPQTQYGKAEDLREQIFELRVEGSNFTEAKTLIERIKNMK